jgi:hypothetical protein
MPFDGAHGGHIPCGVTAHGSPGGPLQFGRLEAALGRQVPLKFMLRAHHAERLIVEPLSSMISPHTLIARQVHHGKEDHQAAREHSKEALAYSNTAHERSEEAIKKSSNTAA